MGFWSFMRDTMVFDWLSHRKKKSFWDQRQRENQRYVNQSLYDDCHDDYRSYSNNDYTQQDFDDDLDSGMFDDDF